MTASFNLAWTTVWMVVQLIEMRITDKNRLSVRMCGVDIVCLTMLGWRCQLDIQIGMWGQLAMWFWTSREKSEPEIKIRTPSAFRKNLKPWNLMERVLQTAWKHTRGPPNIIIYLIGKKRSSWLYDFEKHWALYTIWGIHSACLLPRQRFWKFYSFVSLGILNIFCHGNFFGRTSIHIFFPES